jgi:hypothetical protein
MRRTRHLAIAVAAAAAALAVAVPVGAVPDPDNTCEGGVKIEDPADGTYDVALGGETASITLAVDEASQTFDFTSTGDLSPWSKVVVKGGPGALTWGFDPAVLSADGLHAPLNEASGAYYGLSHVCFFPAPDGGGEEGGGTDGGSE